MTVSISMYSFFSTGPTGQALCRVRLIFTHTYIHTYCIYIHIYILHIHRCIHTRRYIHRYIYKWINAYTCIHTCIHTFLELHFLSIHTHIHTYIHTYIGIQDYHINKMRILYFDAIYDSYESSRSPDNKSSKLSGPEKLEHQMQQEVCMYVCKLNLWFCF